MKLNRLIRGGVEVLRELFRSEELGYDEPARSEATSWLVWLLASEHLEDLPEENTERGSWLAWLLHDETFPSEEGNEEGDDR